MKRIKINGEILQQMSKRMKHTVHNDTIQPAKRCVSDIKELFLLEN